MGTDFRTHSSGRAELLYRLTAGYLQVVGEMQAYLEGKEPQAGLGRGDRP